MVRLRAPFALAVALAVAGGCSSSEDTAPNECSAGEIRCSDDALRVLVCEGGRLDERPCQGGQICEAGNCVDPWSFGSPQFSQCESEPRATPESLADKADAYEELALRLHIHPKLGWLSGVELPPGSDLSTATYQDVLRWRTSPNDGLWSALYLAAEAYRWAASEDPDALDKIELLLAGEVDRMRITSVPGNFTRTLIPPDVPGANCPTDLASYVPDVEKDDDKWVRISTGGCIEYVDADTMQWTESDRCGLDDLSGYCFLDNVSQDEYAGHMLALAAVARLVDDPGIQATVKSLLSQVGHHLLENQLEIVDWDGRVTEHGRFWPGDLVGGYQALMSLAFVKASAAFTDDPELDAFYDDCLLQRAGERECIDHIGASRKPYDELLGTTGLYLGCRSNWNNFSMYMMFMGTFFLAEDDPELRAKVQVALDEAFDPAGEPRPLSEQNNSLFDFIYAANQNVVENGQATAVVENGVCMLRQFPATQTSIDLTCPPDKCVPVCTDRFDDPMTDYPRPVAERCPTRFLWWGSPYETDGCSLNTERVYPPADYLLPYWMGRYYGFIDPES